MLDSITINSRGLRLASSILMSSMAANASVLFEDNFDNGSMSSAWVSKAPSQWVENGWMHTKDSNGWPRDSMAIVHDSDHSWSNYSVSLNADFVQGSLSNFDIGKTWNDFTLLLRTDNFSRTSASGTGRAYQLTFQSSTPSGFSDNISLTRTDYDTRSFVRLFTQPLDIGIDPVLINVSLINENIKLMVDNELIFDLADPDPLLYGGVGIHAIWEAEARIDNIRIVPTPGTILIVLSALPLVLGFRHKAT